MDIGGKIKGSFKYKWLLITYHGDFEADIDNGGASMTFGMPL